MTLEKKNSYALNLYNNLNSISDIIKLKDNTNKYDYVNDKKLIN